MSESKRYEPRPRQKAQECIEAYLLQNDMSHGGKLPPEREMCRHWDLNRATLRSVLKHMEIDGRLTSVQGSGNRFLPYVDRQLQDLKSFSQYAADLGKRAGSRLLGMSVVECDKQMARRFKRVLGDKLYRLMRLRLMDDVPLMIETAYIPVELAPGLEHHDFANGSLFAVLEKHYHLTTELGSEKISVTRVTEEEAEYLEVEPGVPAFWIVSEVYADSGVLVEYCRTIARCDRMEMSSTLYWIGEEI